ncbi:hypothetical protein BDW71DRAFT_175571 [Aspergillus fruticulosus]
MRLPLRSHYKNVTSHCPHVLFKAPDDHSSATGRAARRSLSGDEYFRVHAVKEHVRIPASRSAVALAKKSKPQYLPLWSLATWERWIVCKP